MSTLTFQADLTQRTGFRLAARFECGPGVTALIGPSGSGKSTILSLIAGLRRPDQGLLRLGDRVLTDTAKGIHVPPNLRNVGLVFQDGCLFPHLSVQKNLEYGWSRRGGGPSRLKEIVEILEIDTLLTRAPLTLSGGEQRRVALGRALLQGPELLLLDEPLSGLDAALQDRVLAYLKRTLAKYTVTTLLVTHDPRHIEELAQQQLRIANGKIE